MSFRVVTLVTVGVALMLICAAGPCRAVQTGTGSSYAATASQAENQQAYHLPPDKLAKAIVLNRIRTFLDIGGSIWGLVVLWLLLATRTAARLEARIESVVRGRWRQGLVFFATLTVIVTVASFPLDVIGHTASLHYHISVQGWGSWLVDNAKGLGLSLVVGVPVLLLFNWIVRVSPRWYWLWGWGIAVPLMVLSIFVEPLIEPFFNKFEPLSEHYPKLVTELEKVVAKTGTNIPPDRMFLMLASEKTNGLNAYVTGIGATKRIVVWDTTAERIPDDEILFAFGHETGHYVLHHIQKSLVISSFTLFFVFWVCAGVAERLVRRCQGRWQVESPSSRAGFVVILFVLSVAGFLLQPAGNAVSRYFEHQADVYGQEAIHGIVPDPEKTAVAAFNALGESGLEDPEPNAFAVFWMYTHPPMERRAEFAARYDPWKKSGTGMYFRQ
jgi:Zn-dependent protease with chaperone function